MVNLTMASARVWCGASILRPHAEIEQIENSAHYPMQETPVHFATRLESFISKSA
jgi:hypothetical protein